MADKNSPLRLHKGHRKILESLSFYRFLTLEQITRLHFGNNSYTHSSTLCNQLAKNGYLLDNPLYVERQGDHGKHTHVHTLASDGFAYLESVDIEIDPKDRAAPSEQYELSDTFLKHTLAVNDLFISAELLCREQTEIVARRRYHDFTLKRLIPQRQQTVFVESEMHSKVSVIPDGFIEFVIRKSDGKRYRRPVLLELDRATERQPQLGRKLRALIDWYEAGRYEAVFGTPLFSVAVVTTGSSQRLQTMLETAEKVLSEKGWEDQGERFYFTNRSAVETPPQDFYLGELWQQPFSKTTTTLLEI